MAQLVVGSTLQRHRKKMIEIGHFMLGYSLTLLALITTGWSHRIRHDGITSLLGGLFATLPDAWWVLPQPIKNTCHSFHNSIWANICFLHQAMDKLYPKDKPISAIPLILFATTVSIGLLYIEHKHL